MTASSQPLPAPAWLNPVSAGLLSLAAVSSFTLLLGAVFLPTEALRLYPSQHISVTHVLPPDDQHDGVVLFWSIAEQGAPGWRHHLSVAGIERPLVGDDQRPLEPLTIASVPGTNQSVIGNWDGSLYMLDHEQPDGPPSLLGRQSDGGVVDVACSPDGRFAVSLNAFSLYGWDLIEQRERWRRSDVQASCLALGPTGMSVFVGDSAGELLEIDVLTGAIRQAPLRLDSPAVALTLSPDGQQLAMLAADGRLHLHDSRSLAIEWTTAVGWHVASGRFIAFSPQGDLLVTTDPANPRAVAVLDLLQRKQRGSLMGHEGLVLGASFTTGGALWTWGTDGRVVTWDIGSQRPVKITQYAPLVRSAS